MAERRMFHTAVVESDAFLDLPVGAQALYFHLGMQADEDGFVNGPKQIARKIGRPLNDLQLLEVSGFILNLDGVVVITHWRMANTLQNDRLKDLRYPDLARRIYINETRCYCLEGDESKSLYVTKNALLESIRNPNRTKQNKTKHNKAKNSINESNRKEENPPSGGADCPGQQVAPAVTSEDRGAVDANGPAGENVRRNYDDTYVVLHTFGQDLVHLTKAQIQGLRRIMGEVSLDIYAHRLAKLIREKGDPGNHYETIKNWYLERCGENDQSLYAL